MDLNYIYQRHAVSLHNAEVATCALSRRAHGELAAGYAQMIEGAKARTGKSARS